MPTTIPQARDQVRPDHDTAENLEALLDHVAGAGRGPRVFVADVLVWWAIVRSARCSP